MSTPESLHMLITLVTLGLAVMFFIWGRFRSDLVALCALLTLLLTGVLDTREALSGFSNSVIFVAAGMFVISGAIVRTGLASIISSKILGVAGKNTTVLFMLVMFLATIIGSLVSNTGTVAIMMPIVVSMAMAIDESPSRFLMPLAFMSSIGGMFTLIGNSPNMVVNDAYIKAGFPSLHLFSFFPVGVVCFIFGMLVLAPSVSFYLSRRKNSKEEFKKKGMSQKDLVNKYHLTQNLYQVTVGRDSPWCGKHLADLKLPETHGVMALEIRREEHNPGYFAFHPRHAPFAPGPETKIKPGDAIWVLGPQDGVEAMSHTCGLVLSAFDGGDQGGDKLQFRSVGVCELVLMSSSRLVNHTVAESNLRQKFGVTVLGIQRSDRYLIENIKDEEMQAGDSLLVQGSWEHLGRLEEYTAMNWVVVGRPREHAGSGRLRAKIPLLVTVILLMIVAMAFSLVPTVAAVVAAAVILVFGGCYRNMDEAYSVINWETLVLIAGLLPIALAMEKTGIVGVVSEQMVALCSSRGPHVALAAIYAVTSIMNIFMSTTPVALLISPVAVQIAMSLGYSPLPFLFAVATAASMCFASPFSTPSNALVMSAGRYTFMDYMKIGLPMQIAMGVVMVPVLPLLFPFGNGA